ncbi:DNA-processing protein DprA [[Clostridium] fimetarium]|uniref:DNA processing protein n=1 Tax=[Clostridium] fimetarium TaxID=99656 RepID=A0A1I0N0D2_9FIRM|nr:DNA-processing protein DprA [[Clostridium] fimetarium]SEV94540.1 DNA processing protein [[Clostridium] fimetarium]
MDKSVEDYYWYWLCNIPDIGNAKIRAMLNIFGNAKEVYDASDKLLGYVQDLKDKEINSIIESKKDNDIYINFMKLEEKKIKFVHVESDDYPNRLKKIFDFPYGLYYKGNLPQENIPTVAIIGARDCTNYGREIAKMFGYEFSKLGVQVISGMARGIDSYGHVGAINAGGSTYAILGCGVDICYPKENINLYSDILQQGGIISEYSPGTNPLAYQFPMRNRIISGLADVIIVVEAREKSGSLITVDQALEQNKEVMVVPGRIGDRLSEGCNNLIKMGAQVITTPMDAYENLGIMQYISSKSDNNNKNMQADSAQDNFTLACQDKMVYSCVDLFPKSINSIIEETGLDIKVITNVLLNLELRNYIREISKNYYVRVINSAQFS